MIFGISQGVVIQLKVSNSFTNGINNTTATKTEIIQIIVITRFLNTSCIE